MYLTAQEAGLEPNAEDQAYLEGLDAYLEETAAGYGLTVEELMIANFGPGADKEGYRYFQDLYLNGLPYYEAESAKLVPTQEVLEAYFAEHAEDYAASGITQDSKVIDVRHILAKVADTATEEDWKACEEKAQAILDEWLAGDKTEESFAALASEKTEDPGSQATGGLYQQVYEGQMVPEFNDWCFDASRQYGDYGLVKTDYGYHVMFFVGSQLQWTTYAASDWANEQSAKLLEDIVAKYPMEVTYENIALGVVALG
jgi:parvulin-like peptidyl-prolyl isomerase